jgi:iron complex outermembrane receptor protein
MKFFTKKFPQNFLIILFLLGMQWMAGAQRTITGVVKDLETGETLIGATVVEKEVPNNGAVTDIDGQFTLKVSEKGTAILVSYTGYDSYEQSIVGVSKVEVNLNAGALLKEVLVIGYGTVKREDATGLVQAVTTDKFNKGAITSPQELLAGKVSGVVISTDGSPGGGSKIRVRGESSISGNNDPLIVVDGVPLDNGGVSGSRNALNLINPNDIETFTVLKDASATAIYGNRASAGVILITTKKGTLNKKIAVNYNANVSLGQTANRVDVLTADEFRAAVNERYTTSAILNLMGNTSTDWQDEIYQNAIGTDHNLSVGGGIGILPYRVSVGYTNKNGVLKTDNFNRYSGSLNLSPQLLSNRLQVNFNLKGILSKNHFADRGAIGSALSFDPTKPVRDTSELYGGFTTWTKAGTPNPLAPANPVALLELRDDNSTVKQFITSLALDYRFKALPALRANLNLAYDYGNGSGTVVVPNYAAFAFDALNGGGVNNVYEQTKTNSLLEAYLNYKKTFGIHGIDVMGGYSWQHFEVDNSFKNTDTAGTPAETTEDPSTPSEYYLVSLFGRVNYDINGKYLFTASLRRDGTSKFAPEYRWGLFPAAAFAVKLIDNDHKYFNNLKLRTSWGITGNEGGINYYAYQASYQYGQSNAAYQFGNSFINTLRPNGYAADIKWEETTTYNGGLDFNLVRNRVNGSLDVYKRYTKDLLNFIQIPALSNLTNFITDNIGTMETEGVELSLNLTPVLNDHVKWDLSTNFSVNKNKITKLTTSEDPTYIGVQTGGIAGGVGSNIQIHTVGYSPSSFYVYKQLYDENGAILEGQFADLNGDGVVDAKDQYHYQKPAPTYTLGLTNNISFYNFNFSFAGRANLGQYVYNNVQTDMGYLNRLYNSSGYLANVHQSAVDLNVVDQAKLTFSDHFVKKADFFRLDHVTLGYTFNNVIGKSLNVYTTIQNPLVVTKYDGLDPELGDGIDNNVYPRPRTYLLGLNVNF